MPRSGSGTFTLVSGNPVVTGTTIESTWANNTLSDIATAMTDSLSRSGQGGMTAAFRAADGSSSVPGVSWSNETGTGFYRAGSGDTRFVVGTTEVQKWLSTGTAITGTLSATGNVSLDGGSFVFNESGADKDARFEGDTDANLLFVDASTDRIGIGTATPSYKVDINGSIAIGSDARVNGNVVGTGATTTVYNASGDVYVRGGTGSKLSLGANNTNDLVVLDSSGNLGIGTSSPGVKLEVAGDVRLTGANPSLSAVPTSTGFYIDNRGIGKSTIFRVSSASAIDTTAATLDASGNLGVGTIPTTKVDVVGVNGEGIQFRTGTRTVGIGQVSNEATLYWGSGTALTFFAGSERMRLDASGNLGIGRTPAAKLDVFGTVGQISTAAIGSNCIWDVGTSATRVRMAAAAATNDFLTGAIQTDGLIYAPTDRLLVGTAGAKDTLFYTNNTERARITSGGDLLVGTTAGIASERLNVTKDIANYVGRIYNTNASSPAGLAIRYDAAAPNAASNEFVYCFDTAALRASIRSNGGLANYSANDVNLSDRREKTNFAPAKSYLDTICAIPVQTFNYIDQSEDDPGLTLGVVAQDVQAVAPELVMESNWGTEDNPKMRLSIYQTDLQYALMKCIQEQQELIKDLRARVAALEAA